LIKDTIRITKSIGYLDNGEAPKVNDATVVIIDSTGGSFVVDTFKNVGNGNYISMTSKPQPLHSYIMFVRFSTGDTVRFGYYSQAGIDIKEDKRVLEVVKDIAEYIELSKGEQLSASQLCKRFLFDDKMQHTFVSKLSGGEKRRLFLLTVLIKNPNFLILDEPTNDLDIDTLNVLEEFLESFKGCLLIVTHDRYFMDKLVDHLFLFEGNGVVRDFNGNYQDYLNEEKLPPEQDVKHTITQQIVEKEKPKADSNKKKSTFNEKREYNQLTTDIASLELDKKELENKLSTPDLHFEEIQKLAATLQQINHDIDLKSLRWLELNEICE
jgi:ATP-binding cassette subfamily F protein uup